MKESSVNVTLGVGEIVKEVKDTKTIEEVDKTSALVVRAIHAALSPLEKWVLQKEYNLSETKKLLEEKLKDIPAENIITPPAYVAVPALQSIAYCMDDIQLRDMYAELLAHRLNNEVVYKYIEDVWDVFFVGVHNAELTQQAADLMNKYNQIADKIPGNGYIATWCAENYARLIVLWLRRNDYRAAANCWKQMMKFQQRFTDDEDILKAIAMVANDLYDIYRENQVLGRRRKLLKDMERIFDETHNVDVANTLAILEANEHAIYDPPAVFDSNKAEILLSTEERLREIYEAFPNEGKVVLGYSYLVSWNYVTWLDFPRPIDEELISLFKKWIRKFPENKLELMEYYSFILFEKWLYMDSLDNISEANKIYYEIKAIADELSKDYADNQVTQMLSMGIVRKL